MNISRLFLILFFIFLTSCQLEKSHKILLKDANIINVINGQISSKTILIENGVIKKIGNYENFNHNSQIEIVECKNKYILPGFFDMHTHILEHKNSTQFLDSLLKLGITSIRDMGGHADSIAQLKLDIKKNKKSSPNIYFAGYTLDGSKNREEPDLTTWIISDTTNLKSIVSKLKGYNIDFIKVHSYFPSSRLEELITIANENNLAVVGHIPRKIAPDEALSLGLKSVEHINSIIESLLTKENNNINTMTDAFTALDSTYLESLSNSFKKNDAAFVPTLHILNKIYQSNPDKNMRKLGEIMMERFLKATSTLHKNGVLILSGSDDVPIDETNLTSLHKELQWLVKAGLSPLEAIQAATINPAKFLKLDSEYGTLEINKRADILILNKNPLKNISNTLDIFMTIKNGELLN